MRLLNCISCLLLFFSVDRLSAKDPLPEALTILQEAYQAATNNLISGSGTGIYEIYASPSGKDAKQELKVKAKAKVFFDHSKFHIRLDYEKDIHRLESRIIVYDGTAILVSRTSKDIHPAGSEGDIYEADPTPRTLAQMSFIYNPCRLPLNILEVDRLSNPEYASQLTITEDANKDYSGSYLFTGAPHHLRGTFLASHSAGYNITAYRLLLIDSNNYPYITCRAAWERKKKVWYVKSIDTQDSHEDGRSERSIFKYTNFEPNVEVSPSLFKFEALSLTPNARVIDRRPNAEQRVLRQSASSKVDAAKLDKLADTVKTLAPDSPKHGVSRSFSLRSPRSRKYSLLASGAFVCILGLLWLWRRRMRARKANTAPNP